MPRHEREEGKQQRRCRPLHACSKFGSPCTHGIETHVHARMHAQVLFLDSDSLRFHGTYAPFLPMHPLMTPDPHIPTPMQVLFLDSDSFLLRDPSYLFESEEYRATGALFWQDYWAASPAPQVGWLWLASF